jgi:hypothetical protein
MIYPLKRPVNPRTLDTIAYMTNILRSLIQNLAVSSGPVCMGAWL